METINFLLALGSIGLQVLAAGFLAVYFLQRHFPDLAAIGAWLSRWGIRIGFVLALVGSAMTLIHQYYFGLPPCPLCWWQRIFLYPQVILFGLAVWRIDRSVTLYAIFLSAIGAIVALYHHLLQVFPSGGLPCPAEGEISCAQVLFLELGYITYPMMAISLFAFLVVIMLFAHEDDTRRVP